MNKYEFNSKLFSAKEIKKTISEATIEDKEEYLVIKTTTIHDRQKNKASLNDKAKIIPKKVATPLPPLNFNHTGNICPRNTIRAEKYIKSGKKLFVIKTGTIPFKISKNKVSIAINLFPALKTLVAPIFLEPISLMSFFKNNLVRIKPNGIEPKIYEKMKTNNISNVTVN